MGLGRGTWAGPGRGARACVAVGRDVCADRDARRAAAGGRFGPVGPRGGRDDGASGGAGVGRLRDPQERGRMDRGDWARGAGRRTRRTRPRRRPGCHGVCPRVPGLGASPRPAPDLDPDPRRSAPRRTPRPPNLGFRGHPLVPDLKRSPGGRRSRLAPKPDRKVPSQRRTSLTAPVVSDPFHPKGSHSTRLRPDL